MSELCLACGLCCDGSLFGRVPLAPEEVDVARKNRLRVIPSGRAMEQPCAALEGGACTAYAERPNACRAFECRLHERHRREGGPLEPRLAAVRRVRELLDRVNASPDSEAVRAEPWFAELAQRIEDDFGRVR